MAKKLCCKPVIRLSIALLTIGAIVSGLPTSVLLHLNVQPEGVNVLWSNSDRAFAGTSGGRMRGGSFNGGSPPSSHRSRSSNRPSSSFSHSSSDRDSDSSNHPLDILFYLIILGSFLLSPGIRPIWMAWIFKQGSPQSYAQSEPAYPQLEPAYPASPYSSMSLPTIASSTPYSAAERLSSQWQLNELYNNTVTITQVQIAMVAQARDVQRSLNQLATEANLETQEGLASALRETVLAVLRLSETWTHVQTYSKTVKTRQDAQQCFEERSLAERSKFDVESLVNVSGQVKRQAIPQRDEGPAAYIVVTLIVATAHDRPLLDRVTSVEELQTVLKQLGAMPPHYLMVYEVLWSPQDEQDGLTYDELLVNYPTMLQII